MFDEKLIRKTIEEKLRKKGYSESNSFDLAFHMTDWMREFEELFEFYKKPKKYNKDIEELVMGIIFHASNHIYSAAKLLGYEPSEICGTQ
jgi:hypothetical protein